MRVQMPIALVHCGSGAGASRQRAQLSMEQLQQLLQSVKLLLEWLHCTHESLRALQRAQTAAPNDLLLVQHRLRSFQVRFSLLSSDYQTYSYEYIIVQTEF